MEKDKKMSKEPDKVKKLLSKIKAKIKLSKGWVLKLGIASDMRKKKY